MIDHGELTATDGNFKDFLMYPSLSKQTTLCYNALANFFMGAYVISKVWLRKNTLHLITVLCFHLIIKVTCIVKTNYTVTAKTGSCPF